MEKVESKLKIENTEFYDQKLWRRRRTQREREREKQSEMFMRQNGECNEYT